MILNTNGSRLEVPIVANGIEPKLVQYTTQYIPATMDDATNLKVRCIVRWAGQYNKNTNIWKR